VVKTKINQQMTVMSSVVETSHEISPLAPLGRNDELIMKTTKLVLLGLFLTASISINAAEEDEWLQSGSMQEKTDNWLKGGIKPGETAPETPTVPLNMPSAAGLLALGLTMSVYVRKKKLARR
jgi:hypothetical protein